MICAALNVSSRRRHSVRRTICLALPCIVFSAKQSFSQEALANALRADAAERLRAQPPVARPAQDILRIGPVVFDVGVRYTIEATDNVSYSETDRRTEFIQRPSISVGLNYPITPNSSLSVAGRFGYIDYIRNSSPDRFFIAPDSALSYDVRFGNTTITIYDRFDYSQDVAAEGGLTGVAEFPTFQNLVGLRAGWRGERWSVLGGYGHLNVFSIEDEFEHVDRADEQFFARVGYRYPSTLEIGLEGSATLSDYALDTEIDRQNFSLGPFVSRTVGPFQISVRGGVSYSAFEAADASSEDGDLTSYYFGASVEHDLTRHISHGLTLSHGIRAGLIRGGDYIQSTDISYQIGWAFMDPARAALRVFGEMAEQTAIDDTTGVVSENYNRVGVSLDVTYDLTRRLSFVGRYSFVSRDSDVPLRSYNENRVTLGANYRF